MATIPRSHSVIWIKWQYIHALPANVGFVDLGPFCVWFVWPRITRKAKVHSRTSSLRPFCAGLKKRAISCPLVKGNEDPGYEDARCMANSQKVALWRNFLLFTRALGTRGTTIGKRNYWSLRWWKFCSDLTNFTEGISLRVKCCLY